MLYSPALCSGIAQNSPDPFLLESPGGVPSSCSFLCVPIACCLLGRLSVCMLPSCVSMELRSIALHSGT